MMIKSIAKYLDGLGYVNYYESGFNESNNCFLNYVPESPINLVTIKDTGGQGNIYNFSHSIRSAQIYVRNENSNDAHLLIWSIYEALINTTNGGFLFIDDRKMQIKAKNQPISLGKDNNNYHEFSFNVDVYTRTDL
jgi:hypothetical protein